MLAVDEHEIVTGGLGDARDVAGARNTRNHAERNFVGLEEFFNRIFQNHCIGHFVLREIS